MALRTITFVADYSSPIARRWIHNIVEAGVTVHVVSTRSFKRSPKDAELASIVVVAPPLESLLRLLVVRRRRGGGPTALASPLDQRVRSMPFLVMLTRSRARAAITRQAPDLVHALRLPIEAMVAAQAIGGKLPLVVSVWGNDFTLYAGGYPAIGKLTRRALAATDGLLADCERDRQLATSWGFNSGKPSAVLPGNGGIDLSVFAPIPPDTAVLKRLGLAEVEGPVVFNPRGLRHYVRTVEFLRAIPIVLGDHPDAHFVCAGLKGTQIAERFVAEAGIRGSVTLLRTLTEEEMVTVFRRAEVSVSPSVHDGTPNSLLEAMASGCFPVAGRLPSIEEWIRHRENGLLVDSNDPYDIAEKIELALSDEALRARARGFNLELVRDRAEQHACKVAAIAFYERLLGAPERPSPRSRGGEGK